MSQLGHLGSQVALHPKGALALEFEGLDPVARLPRGSPSVRLPVGTSPMSVGDDDVRRGLA